MCVCVRVGGGMLQPHHFMTVVVSINKLLQDKEQTTFDLKKR